MVNIKEIEKSGDLAYICPTLRSYRVIGPGSASAIVKGTCLHPNSNGTCEVRNIKDCKDGGNVTFWTNGTVCIYEIYKED